MLYRANFTPRCLLACVELAYLNACLLAIEIEPNEIAIPSETNSTLPEPDNIQPEVAPEARTKEEESTKSPDDCDSDSGCDVLAKKDSDLLDRFIASRRRTHVS
jgi:hypothetical protein